MTVSLQTYFSSSILALKSVELSAAVRVWAEKWAPAKSYLLPRHVKEARAWHSVFSSTPSHFFVNDECGLGSAVAQKKKKTAGKRRGKGREGRERLIQRRRRRRWQTGEGHQRYVLFRNLRGE